MDLKGVVLRASPGQAGAIKAPGLEAGCSLVGQRQSA